MYAELFSVKLRCLRYISLDSLLQPAFKLTNCVGYKDVDFLHNRSSLKPSLFSDSLPHANSPQRCVFKSWLPRPHNPGNP